MITAYTEYFEGFAENHPQLLHENTDGNRAFFTIDFMELLGSFRNGIKEKGSALYALNYQSRFENLNLEKFEGGFVVMSWFDKDSFESRKNAMSSTETIAKNLIAKMQDDSNRLHSLFLDSFQTLESFEKVPYQYQANNDYIGWLVTFRFYHSHRMSDYLDYSDSVTDDSDLYLADNGGFLPTEHLSDLNNVDTDREILFAVQEKQDDGNFRWKRLKTDIQEISEDVFQNYTFVLVESAVEITITDVSTTEQTLFQYAFTPIITHDFIRLEDGLVLYKSGDNYYSQETAIAGIITNDIEGLTITTNSQDVLKIIKNEND